MDYGLTNATSQIGCDETVKQNSRQSCGAYDILGRIFPSIPKRGTTITRVGVSVGQNLSMSNEHDDLQCAFVDVSTWAIRTLLFASECISRVSFTYARIYLQMQFSFSVSRKSFRPALARFLMVFSGYGIVRRRKQMARMLTSVNYIETTRKFGKCLKDQDIPQIFS